MVLSSHSRSTLHNYKLPPEQTYEEQVQSKCITLVFPCSLPINVKELTVVRQSLTSTHGSDLSKDGKGGWPRVKGNYCG